MFSEQGSTKSFTIFFKFKEFTETNTCLQSTVQSVNGKCRNSNYNSGSVGRKTTLIMAQHREYKPENRTTIVCLQRLDTTWRPVFQNAKMFNWIIFVFTLVYFEKLPPKQIVLLCLETKSKYSNIIENFHPKTKSGHKK